MRKERLQQRLEKKTAYLDSLYELRDDAVASGGVYEWTQDGGDSSSSTKMITLTEIDSLISSAESEVDSLEDALSALEGNRSGTAFRIRGSF